MCNATVKQIDILIRARTPVIAINSHEEARVEGEIRALIDAQNTREGAQTHKQVVTWSVSRGFTYRNAAGAEQANPVKDPAAALLVAAGLVSGQSATGAPSGSDPQATVYLFKDVHAFFHAPQVVRALRDAAAALKEQHSTIILMGADVSVPTDAEKEIVVVHFPLPTGAELADQLDVFTAGLPETVAVDLSNGTREELIRALQGLTQAEADSVLSQAAIAHRCLDRRVIDFVLKAKAAIIRKNKAMEYTDRVDPREVGGLDLLMDWAETARLAMSDEAREFGITPPKGVLLVGVPGCGKSLSVKTLAGPGVPIVSFNLAATQSKYVGESGQNLRQGFKVAEAIAPCVLHIDEIDKVMSVGGSGAEAGTTGSVQFQQLGELLTWMQEARDNGVFIAATANYVAGLDPALIRRFDRTFFVDFPTVDERAEILAIHLRKKRRDPAAFDLQALAHAAEMFTGSEIEQVVNAALMRAFKAHRELTDQDLLDEIADVVPLATKMGTKIDQMRDWAKQANPASSRQESGHRQEQGSRLEF